MSPLEGVLAARLHGTWDDRSLDYDAAVQLEGRALRIAFDTTQPQVMDLTVDDLRGAEVRDGQLFLYMQVGRPIVLSGSEHLVGLRHRLEAAACLFPAQTLSLRGFGSERSTPGSDHDRWFEALLSARLQAEESRTIETQRRAFDATRLARHADTTFDRWASDRFEDAADRRALVAELGELAAPYRTALERMDEAAVRMRLAPAELQFDRWREWTLSVRDAFHAADEVWLLAVPALCGSRGATGALWRRFLRPRRRTTDA